MLQSLLPSFFLRYLFSLVFLCFCFRLFLRLPFFCHPSSRHLSHQRFSFPLSFACVPADMNLSICFVPSPLRALIDCFGWGLALTLAASLKGAWVLSLAVEILIQLFNKKPLFPRVDGTLSLMLNCLLSPPTASLWSVLRPLAGWTHPPQLLHHFGTEWDQKQKQSETLGCDPQVPASHIPDSLIASLSVCGVWRAHRRVCVAVYCVCSVCAWVRWVCGGGGVHVMCALFCVVCMSCVRCCVCCVCCVCGVACVVCAARALSRVSCMLCARCHACRVRFQNVAEKQTVDIPEQRKHTTRYSENTKNTATYHKTTTHHNKTPTQNTTYTNKNIPLHTTMKVVCRGCSECHSNLCVTNARVFTIAPRYHSWVTLRICLNLLTVRLRSWRHSVTSRELLCCALCVSVFAFLVEEFVDIVCPSFLWVTLVNSVLAIGGVCVWDCDLLSTFFRYASQRSWPLCTVTFFVAHSSVRCDVFKRSCQNPSRFKIKNSTNILLFFSFNIFIFKENRILLI